MSHVDQNRVSPNRRSTRHADCGSSFPPSGSGVGCKWQQASNQLIGRQEERPRLRPSKPAAGSCGTTSEAVLRRGSDGPELVPAAPTVPSPPPEQRRMGNDDGAPSQDTSWRLSPDPNLFLPSAYSDALALVRQPA